MKGDSISDLRKQFEAIDKDLLILLGKRIDLSKKIAVLKKEKAINILQTNIWEKQLQNRLKENEALKIDADFLKTFFSLIHEESIRIQKKELE